MSSNGPGNDFFMGEIDANNKLNISIGDGTSVICDLLSPGLLRDPAAWYHICVVVATAESVAADRIKLYVNGTQETLTGTALGTQSYVPEWNAAVYDQYIGGWVGGTFYNEGYLADFYSIDGTAVTPMDNFIETDGTTGQLKPKAYTTSLGTEGFHLDFKVAPGTDDGAGTDVSGNANHFSETNLVASDQMNDRPTNNYSVWNPLTTSHAVLTEGNLEGDAADNVATVGSIGVNSGQWYWEIYTDSGDYMPYIGVTSIADDDWDFGGTDYASAGRSFIGGNNGNKNYDATSVDTSVADLSGTAVWGMALDFSAGTLKYYKDGTLKHTDDAIPTDGTTLWPFQVTTNSGGASWKNFVLNAGQDPTFAGKDSSTPATSEFAETVPEGYSALSTANLPDPPIADGTEHFDTLLYTGTEASSQDHTGLSFTPDLTWIKNRDADYSHVVGDVVRGDNNFLATNSSGAESTDSEKFRTFVTEGIQVGPHEGTGDDYDYVAWNWKAGTGFDPAGGVATTDGSKNATAGFSIAKWTGNSTDYDSTSHRTLAHGLSAAPNFSLLKSRASQNWLVYHKSLTAGKFLVLNDTYGSSDHGGNLIVDAGWDATNFKVGNDGYSSGYNLNVNSTDYIGYFFSEVAGYSKFGSYGPSDYPFVWLGFRPSFLMLFNHDGSSSWAIHDSARDTYNYTIKRLYPNLSSEEFGSELETTYGIDFLSNGLKIKASHSTTSDGYSPFIYAAFAEQPFKYAAAR